MAGQQFILRDPNGTYFRGFAMLGPMFGGTRENAARFDSRADVAAALGRHFAMAECEIETVGEPRKQKRGKRR